MADNLFRKTGVIHSIGDLKEGVKNEREWKLRSLILEETREWNDKKYSDFTEFTGFGKAVDGMADLSVGDKVEVVFVVSSREQEAKESGNKYWRTTCKAISIKTIEEVGGQEPVLFGQDVDTTPQPDDLPF